MQVPWFFYRIWKEFNHTGLLKTNKLKNFKEITRGSSNWVIEAEKECSKDKILEYLKFISNPLKIKIEEFWGEYIYNNNKAFTVRKLSIDIEYTNNDVYKFEDCSRICNKLNISDVYNECCNYFDTLVDLFENVYNEIYPNISLLSDFQDVNGNVNITSSNNTIDLNSFFHQHKK